MTVEDELEVSGGAETDIRRLFYWSRTAFFVLTAAAVVWVVLGVYNLYTGLPWVALDSRTGSTQASSDIAWGIVYLVAAVFSFLLARWLENDIIVVFGSRRFQVPRERLLVYSMLALPFGLVLAGVLLIMVNVKLSHPEFLPSHSEAYPEGMPGWVRQATPTGAMVEDAMVEELVGEEEKIQDEDALMETPAPDLQPLAFQPRPGVPPPMPTMARAEEGLAEVPPPGLIAEAPVAAMVEPVAAMVEPVAAMVEPVDVEIPEVMAVVAEPTPVGAPPPAMVEAVVEDVPPEGDAGLLYEEVPAEVEEFALVEEVPAEVEEFALVEELPAEVEELPRDTEVAHQELMDKLLGK